jgi:azurin
MKLGYKAAILMLALLLMANSVAATTCAIFVIDDYKMTVNNAKIYIDDSSKPIGTTAYNAGFGQNCWIGDLNLNGTHTLSAKWTKATNGEHYEGVATVEFMGETKMRISIPTHRT